MNSAYTCSLKNMIFCRLPLKYLHERCIILDNAHFLPKEGIWRHVTPHEGETKTCEQAEFFH